MASTGRQDPEAPDDDTRWRTAGDRIQTLLDASAGSGTVVRERAEQLAGEITDLYGAALERIVSIAAESDAGLVEPIRRRRPGRQPACWCTACTRTAWSAGSRTRWTASGPTWVRTAATSRCSRSSTTPDGPVVRLQFAGSCKSCPSSAVTLEFAVEDAVRAAAPEIASIEVVAARVRSSARPGLISADSLMSRVHTRDSARPPGIRFPTSPISARARSADSWSPGRTVLACRVGDDLFAYHDRCGGCDESMAGAALHRPMGAPIGAGGSAVPALPRPLRRRARRCGRRRRSRAATHLDPIPLLRARRRAVGGGARRGRPG